MVSGFGFRVGGLGPGSADAKAPPEESEGGFEDAARLPFEAPPPWAPEATAPAEREILLY